jgi:hypothetical protein
MRQKVGDGFIHHRRRDHQPDRPRLFQLRHKILQRGASPAFSFTSSLTAFGDLSKTRTGGLL